MGDESALLETLPDAELEGEDGVVPETNEETGEEVGGVRTVEADGTVLKTEGDGENGGLLEEPKADARGSVTGTEARPEGLECDCAGSVVGARSEGAVFVETRRDP